MRTILLVDDEEFVLEGIRMSLPWQDMGIDKVLTAQNGAQALKILDGRKIDVVITDVKMPMMDGIELLRQMQLRGYSCKVIVLSGYDDFSYAQEAIRYNVVEYLLKPIVLSKLKAAIEKAVLLSLESQSNEAYLQALEQQFEVYRPVLAEHLVQELLRGNVNYCLASLLSLPARPAGFQAVRVHIDNFDSNRDLRPEAEETLRQVSAQEILKHVREFRFTGATHIAARVEGYDFVLILMAEQENMPDITPQLEALQKVLEDKTQHTFTFSIGTFCRDPQDIAESYEKACDAMKSKVLYGNSSIISYQDLYTQDVISAPPTFNKEKTAVLDCLRNRDKKVLHSSLADIKKRLLETHVQNIDYIRQIGIELLAGATLFLYEQNETPDRVICVYQNPLSTVSRLESLDEIFDVVEEVYVQIIEYFDCKGNLKNQKTVARICEFVKENLGSDISLDALAHELQLTPNYVGTLFRKSTNLYFSEYVMRERMEHAKLLLQDPACKIYEVAAAVGYKNPTYFSKAFKDYTGFNPTEFKR